MTVHSVNRDGTYNIFQGGVFRPQVPPFLIPPIHRPSPQDEIITNGKVRSEVTSSIRNTDRFIGYAQDIRSGLLMEMYNNFAVEPPVVLTRIFPVIDFIPGNDGENFWEDFSGAFSITIKGFIRLPSSYPEGNYDVIIGHDDEAILRIDGTEYLPFGPTSGYEEDTYSIYFRHGKRYALYVAYFEATTNESRNEIALSWSHPSIPQEFVPKEALFRVVPP